MSLTISQLHEQAKAFRAQFRPFIEILDEVAAISGLEDSRREIESQVAANVTGRAAEEENLTKVKRVLKEKKEELVTVEKQLALVRDDARLARNNFDQEMTQRRSALEIELKGWRKTAETAIDTAHAEAAGDLARIQTAVAAEETKLASLREAIAKIAGG